MTEATQLPEPGPFGDRPECGRNDGYRNKDHWFICHEYKTRWYIGRNLFSSWVYESEEDWAANEMLIAWYRGSSLGTIPGPGANRAPNAGPDTGRKSTLLRHFRQAL